MATKKSSRPRASRVKISYRRVSRSSDSRLKGKRSLFRTESGDRIVAIERSVESLWFEKTPEGWNLMDWFRAWNEGYPDEEHVELYNATWPDDEDRHIMLGEEEL